MYITGLDSVSFCFLFCFPFVFSSLTECIIACKKLSELPLKELLSNTSESYLSANIKLF